MELIILISASLGFIFEANGCKARPGQRAIIEPPWHGAFRYIFSGCKIREKEITGGVTERESWHDVTSSGAT